jgi:hypothetical protein
MWRTYLIAMVLTLVSACSYLGNASVIKVPENQAKINIPQTKGSLYPIPDTKLPTVQKIDITPPEL